MDDAASLTGFGKSRLLRISQDAFGFNRIFRQSGVRRSSSIQESIDLALVDQMPIGLAVYDVDGTLAHANAYFSKLVSCRQLPSRSRRGAQRWQGWSGDGAELDRKDYPCDRALHGEIVSPGIDLLHFDDTGAGRWLNVSSSPIRDPGGDAIVGIVLLFLDTHDKVQSSAFAASAGRRFRQFAENSSTAIWIADAGTREFTYRNPGHIALLDGQSDPASLTDWIAHVDEADRPLVGDHYDRVLAGGTAQREYRLRRAAAGSVRHVRETSFPIRDEAGAIIMIGGITEDITPATDRRLFLIGAADGSPAAAALGRLGSYDVKEFASVGEFAAVARFLAFGCVVIDLAATPDAGDDLLRTLADHAATLPIIVVGTADTRAEAAIAAMRAGAADYLLPPFSDDDLANTLLRAVARFAKPAAQPSVPASAESADRLAGLSPRERDVLMGLKSGGTNKSIGRDLGISPRTVEAHRSRLMERMNVRSLAELLQALQ